MKRTSNPMRAFLVLSTLVALLSLNAGCKRGEGIEPPATKVLPVTLEKHGHVRTDNYYWLRERENPEVREHLEAENRYTAAVMAHTETLQRKMFEEFKARIRQTDMSAPYKKDGYFYYTRMEEGKEYPIYCRKKGTLDAQEQIMLDVNQVAAGHKYCRVRMPEVSPDGTLMAYGVDTGGRRFHTIYFQNLETGEMLPESIPDVTESMVWANDNRTVFYTKQDPTTLRDDRLYRHAIGTDPAEDELVYEEKDETYDCFIFKTKSQKYLLLLVWHVASTEFWYLEADNPRGPWKLVLPRQKEHEYWVDHYKDHFYISTNHEAKNFRLMRTPVGQTAVENWREVLPHRPDVLLEGIEIFRDYLVALERKNGLSQLHILPWSGQEEHSVDFGEAAYAVYPTDNYEFDTALVRYEYASLTTPLSVYAYDMTTREKKLLKREEVLGGFDPANYLTERLYSPADGARIPISLVHHRDFRKDGTSPLFLEGYGAYGSSNDAYFDPFVISLLDRGFVYAIAHIRGGAELGRDWYDQGRLLNKMNTFTDFISCAEHLVREKYADPQRIFAQGASAGGLLIGAVVNLRPDLFRGVIAKVPWVDPLTSSLDERIPLTTTEYDEWGNPNEKKFYDYILSYSPYDNVKAQVYPNVLAMTSFEDSQVQYWEPAKWVAKLRALKTGKNLVLLKTEFEASHGGVSGRYQQYKQRAFEYAFMLDLAGIRQ